MNILKKFDVLKTRYTKWLEPKLKQKVIGKNTTAESCSAWFTMACGAESYDFLHTHYCDTGP